MSQGGTANRAGQCLEDFVEDLARRHDYHVVTYRENINNTDLFATKLLVKNVPYTNFHGTISRSEFVLVDDMAHKRIRIECKWQESAGSLDEKLAYLYLNAARRMPEDEIILLIDGGGAKDALVETIKLWAKTHEFQKQRKIIMVMSMAEFHGWFQRFARLAA